MYGTTTMYEPLPSTEVFISEMLEPDVDEIVWPCENLIGFAYGSFVIQSYVGRAPANVIPVL